MNSKGFKRTVLALSLIPSFWTANVGTSDTEWIKLPHPTAYSYVLRSIFQRYSGNKYLIFYKEMGEFNAKDGGRRCMWFYNGMNENELWYAQICSIHGNYDSSVTIILKTRNPCFFYWKIEKFKIRESKLNTRLRE